MIKEYIFKTIICFISYKAVIYMTLDNWNKLSPKKNGFIKRNINQLAPCLIPVIRWVWVVMIFILGIALGNDDFYDSVSEKMKESDNK